VPQGKNGINAFTIFLLFFLLETTSHRSRMGY